MELETLSASSAQTFELCEARWRAENMLRAPSEDSVPALAGTVCHEALEHWVATEYHINPPFSPVAAMTEIFQECWEKHFGDERDRYDEYLGLCLTWLERTDFTGRKVLSTEVKSNFELPTSVGKIPFNYIWDRCDDIGNDEIEVIDYKTWMLPEQPDTMKNRLQVRCYALAAQIEFPQAKRIWVTLDQLRYDSVGCVFTRDENAETWKYLKRLAERIIASDGTRESLNSDCRWCIRKHNCETLISHAEAGGVMGIHDPAEAAVRRHRAMSALKALEIMVDDLDRIILDHCRDEDLLEFSAGEVDVKITASRRRDVDTQAVIRVIGPEIAGEFAKIGLRAVDKLLKDPRLTVDQKTELKNLIRRKMGQPKVLTTEANPVSAP